jgi:cell division protein ZapA (FtsZ GTPase activity inhibitor)
MKKVFLSLAMIALLVVSCQEKTKEETGEAADAIGNDIEQKVDTLGMEMDTATTKAGNAMENAGKEMKESVE